MHPDTVYISISYIANISGLYYITAFRIQYQFFGRHGYSATPMTQLAISAKRGTTESNALASNPRKLGDIFITEKTSKIDVLF